MTDRERLARALKILAERCPRLVESCYWAGTSAIAMEELDHRRSFDLDFHTRQALEDVRPILAELQKAFPRKVEIVQQPDAFGSGFRALVTMPGKLKITLEVLSNFESVSPAEITRSRTVAAIERVTLRRYLADKIQCIVERVEARDLFDVGAILLRHPELERAARALLRRQDAVLLTERLLSWSDSDIEADLSAYTEVDSTRAIETRDLLLRWVKEEARRSRGR